MKQIILRIDTELALFIYKYIKNPKLDKILSNINKGEVFLIISILSLFLTRKDWLFAFLFVGIFSFLNDRFVLFIKKRVSRKRPSLKLLGNTFQHEDLNHSFPSAHAANSLCAVFLLITCFEQSYFFFLLSFLAGFARLLSLHHFFSDVIGGWTIGLTSGIIGFILYLNWIHKFSFNL
ncbi:MAG: phosphatase PAP2 family protein [Leptospiraceae bacterium]|nr:phosphatase PAP2 family protein [Leptospiraceae bacterium]